MHIGILKRCKLLPYLYLYICSNINNMNCTDIMFRTGECIYFGGHQRQQVYSDYVATETKN